MNKKRYALVGIGGRALEMYAKPITNELQRTAELVALCDINPIRMAYAVTQLPHPIAQFTDFDAMLREARPDGIIVCCRDVNHADYVIRALRAGRRVYSEKPLCITAGQCRQILAAAKKSRGLCLTTHNARYLPSSQAVQRILRSGRLGKILFMQFEETLDRLHGADYFRRWHAHKDNSGGLQIHKASHHFDLLNWWAGSTPVRVEAQGGLRFYGRNNSFRGKRCAGCPHARKCEFHVDVAKFANYRHMYLDAESADGYIRDRCLWDKSIDIEDQFAAHVAYQNGIEVSYSLIAYAPYESMRFVVEGTRGRLELSTIYNTSGWLGQKKALPGIEKNAGERLRLFLPQEGIKELGIPRVRGGHGGADPQLRKDFFARSWETPPNAMMASVEDAVQAVLVGVSISKSIATGRSVAVQDLLKKD